ncbi:MAG: phosphoenolpyruvate carboxylase, partial [Gemmatimonadota bacterium]|nr:phosphoenolpyruvate carboxylase [Gemmatimonadota bacterium]
MNPTSRDVAFPPKDEPLRQDVGMLGALVGEVIKEQGGEDLFSLVEEIRGEAIRRRETDSPDCRALASRLAGLAPARARELVRAFSTYFQVVNLAEQVHRVRRGREYLGRDGPPQSGSLADAVAGLAARGVSAEDAVGLFDDALVEPVFTAHPTEATRRAILEKQRAIAERLLDRLDPSLTPRESATLRARIRTEITTAWQTEEHPSARPTVADEREHVLFYLITVLYGVVPALYEVLEEALRDGYGAYGAGGLSPEPTETRPIVRFSSWVGGDMDGNPAVDADSIRSALGRHQHLILGLYKDELGTLARHLSQSASRVGWLAEVDARIQRYASAYPRVYDAIRARHRAMGYRTLLTLMTARLDHTASGDPEGYEGPHEYLSDLRLIDRSLRANRGEHAGRFAVVRAIRRAEVFGFHMATLDVRQHAERHRKVAGLLLEASGWAGLDPESRADRLRSALAEPGPGILKGGREGSRGDEGNLVEGTLEVFRAIDECRKRFGTAAVGPYIISMATDVDDVLTVLFLDQVARGAVGSDLDVAPLFETVDDLEGAADTLRTLFPDPIYSAHLARRQNRQMVMVGYSDSSKDGGIASARWSLQKAQMKMARAAQESGVSLTLFHGRGGTVSRGGGKVHRAVAASPHAALSGHLRLTEQGEVIDAKYGLPSIALRNLERMLGAVALKMSERTHPPRDADPRWLDVAESMADAGRAAYRAMVHDDPDFPSFFRALTPIDVIERMAIGSRPASRRGGGSVDDLRAIPWVFSWTQTRATLPGWFGMGAGLEAAAEAHGEDLVATAVREWPFLSALVDDIEMVAAKSDLGIASAYMALVPEEAA